jgi:hypothetical protein
MFKVGSSGMIGRTGSTHCSTAGMSHDQHKGNIETLHGKLYGGKVISAHKGSGGPDAEQLGESAAEQEFWTHTRIRAGHYHGERVLCFLDCLCMLKRSAMFLITIAQPVLMACSQSIQDDMCLRAQLLFHTSFIDIIS